jgi:hypothetical protein
MVRVLVVSRTQGVNTLHRLDRTVLGRVLMR